MSLAYCHAGCDRDLAYISPHWSAHQGVAWQAALIRGAGSIDDAGNLPTDPAGAAIYTRRDITGYRYYLWSAERDRTSGIPFINLDSSAGGGIVVDPAQSLIVAHLSPEQTAALKPRSYTVYVYERAPGAELGDPIAVNTLAICRGHTYFPPGAAPPNAAGTALAPVQATAVVTATNTPTVALVTGQSVVQPTNAQRFHLGAGPPPASVGNVGDVYFDIAGGALYNEKTATGWPATPAWEQATPSLEATRTVNNIVEGDIEFANAGDGIVMIAPNGDRTKYTPDDGGQIIANDL